MSDEFEINESHTTFDFKGFLIRLWHHWPLFLIALGIAFTIAYFINVRKQPIYLIDNVISIKDDQNPFFTSNTSLTFNWGGTTDKVNTAIITLKSRSHNEKVVERLQYFTNYQKDGKYEKIDAYKQTPFYVNVDTIGPQMLGQQIQIVFKDSVNFEFSTVFGEEANIIVQDYTTKEKTRVSVKPGIYLQNLKIGTHIKLPYFNGTFMPNPDIAVVPGIKYYISFGEFDKVVKRYLNVRVEPESKGSSVLKMKLTGHNKFRLVDYLNTSVSVLSDNMLERKNLFATKTIKFIDSSLAQKSEELSTVEDELNQFKNKNAIFNLETEGSDITAKLSELDLRKESVNRELNYYETLESYLINRSDYRDVPAPSVAGISEASVVGGVSRIVALAEERNKLQYSFKDGAPIFSDIDRKIDAVKSVLLENIRSSKILQKQELRFLNGEIGRNEGKIRKLPKEQQDLLKIERRYNLSQGTYNLFLAKRSEAGLVKAANVSDVMVIDSAKDTGDGKIGPNTQLNYMMAGMLGLLFPFLFVFIRFFLDTKINDIAELKRLTPIPVLGVLGKSPLKTNIAVIAKPKSAIAEAFRALRSSLQYIYRKQGIKGSKTVLVTSSVSGEGKTFCSINMATVFALSGKKTVLIGLDLRKPKIFGDFNLHNDIGAVNYLIEESEIDDIIQRTELENLDVITSGPIPPNPSELLIDSRLTELIDALKERYSYIVIDSPPLGLVSDSLELIRHADATLYIVRFNYTHKNMLTYVNEKYKSGEIKHISIVLNDYVEKARKGYGYGYTYGYNADGYHENVIRPSLRQRIMNTLRGK